MFTKLSQIHTAEIGASNHETSMPTVHHVLFKMVAAGISSLKIDLKNQFARFSVQCSFLLINTFGTLEVILLKTVEGSFKVAQLYFSAH